MKLFGLEIYTKEDHEKLIEGVEEMRRELDDIGWIKIGQETWGTNQAVKESYQSMVKRCRFAFIKNPIVGQAVNLTTNYTFGEGISVPRAEDAGVQKVIEEFWDHPDNKLSFTSPDSQLKLSNKIQYDGELALALQVDKDGSVYVRIIDTLTINQIIFDPFDNMRALFYKRSVNNKNQYIPDYQNGIALMRDQSPDEWKQLLKSLDIAERDILKDTFLFHVKQNNDILDQRGVPDIYRALDWVNSNNKINSDTATFINASAQYAFKKKVSGTKQQIEQMRARQQQNTALTNPANMAGSTYVSNEKVDLEPVTLPASNGTLFETGIRRTLLMICAAMGIMEHYFGDPSTGNLATSKSMELPMLKKFFARQKIWEGIYLTVLNFALDMNIMAYSRQAFVLNTMKNRATIMRNDFADRSIDIDFPPILEKDLRDLAIGLAEAKAEQLIPIETAQRMFMQGAGINNIDDELKKEFDTSAQAQVSLSGKISGSGDQAGAGTPAVKPAKESITPAVNEDRKKALKLAEKNKAVLSKMNAYKTTISEAYNHFLKEAQLNLRVNLGNNEKFKAHFPGLRPLLIEFQRKMLAAANRYYPEVVGIAESYVKGKIPMKESGKLLEAKKRMDKFIEDQIAWNEGYVKKSLTPAIMKKFRGIEGEEYDTRENAAQSVTEAAGALESRLGQYVSALWTVDQRAVKEMAKDSGQLVNFVGVDDDKTCESCQSALDGNPWPVDEAPVPGEQDCLGNCRHALQIETDESLSESDIQILSDAEKEAKTGFKFLG